MTYIALEGIDGIGKSTICQILLREYPNILLVKEPTQVLPFTDPFARAIAHYADRVNLMREIKQALATNRSVVSDRCYLSTLVYQGHTGVFKYLHEFFSHIIELPQIYVLIDTSSSAYESHVERMKGRNDLPIDHPEYLELMYKYEKLGKSYATVIIDLNDFNHDVEKIAKYIAQTGLQ